MKKIFLAAGCGISLILAGTSGCKEIGPSVNLTAPRTGGYDTVYKLSDAQVAALVTDPHNVLVEEFTGQACNNCPSAHEELANKSEAKPSRINIVGLYFTGLPQAIPPDGHKYDFRAGIATDIAASIFGGINAMPSGGIDRKQSGDNKIINDRSVWSGTIDAQLNILDSLNLSVKSILNPADSSYSIVATVTYTQPMSSKQNLTVVITEDSMIDIQEYPQGFGPHPSGHDENYLFTHVFRDMASSSPVGDPIIDSMATKPKGMVLERHYAYKLPKMTPAIVAKNCHVIAFINNTSGTYKGILQSVQTKLIP